MLRSMTDLEGCAIRATDGVIGHVKDIYFDDDAWIVRYLVVETGSWLSSRKVLISPIAIGDPDWTAGVLPVSIKKEQVRNSPDIDADRPVSRQYEERHSGHYGHPYYWVGAGFWGAGAIPSMMLTKSGYDDGAAQETSARAHLLAGARDGADPHLRSCKAVMGYHIQATDGEIGHVQGLLIDEDTWAVRYVVADTGSWWLGHQVLIAPQWIEEMRWPDNTVAVALTQRALKDAPPYDSTVPLGRELELALHKHHGRVGYWEAEARLENPDYRRAAELASTMSP
jgi:hypothetical protein